MVTTLSSVGKSRRLGRLLSQATGRTVIVPMDDSLISGPAHGLEDLCSVVRQVALGRPDAIMGFPGLFRNHAEALQQVAGILNVTASTTRSCHTRKMLVGCVEEAVRLGLEAVAVHVNISSRYESEMLRTMGWAARECEAAGMPLVGIMYPRREANGSDENYVDLKRQNPNDYAHLVAHAARVGVELGADLIKTQYTGDTDSFRLVVDSCHPVPVIIAGGPPAPALDVLRMAQDAVSAGAVGVSFGRNVFSRSEPARWVAALRAVVHGRVPPEAAIEQAGPVLE